MNGVFDDLYDVADACLLPIVQDPANRGRSWDQCYKFFRRYGDWNEEQRQENRDFACLRLGFYLASWGMFRGSGALIHKDHTIYGRIIDLLFADDYEELRHANFFEGLLTDDNALLPDDQRIGLIFTLKAAVCGYVNGLTVIRGPSQHPEEVTCSDTLVTKILLGTLACTPAYDTNFPNGLAACDIEGCGHFTPECLTNLLNVCREHHLWQTLANEPIQYYDVTYPAMRVVDLYFWYKGRPNP
jgi:hypothetical protein